MNISKPAFAKYLFVCENQRADGACCGPEGVHLRETLKKIVKDKGLAERIRVSRSGCLDVCSEGPNILLMPDNIWFKHVEEKDVEEIIKMAKLSSSNAFSPEANPSIGRFASRTNPPQADIGDQPSHDSR